MRRAVLDTTTSHDTRRTNANDNGIGDDGGDTGVIVVRRGLDRGQGFNITQFSADVIAALGL